MGALQVVELPQRKNENGGIRQLLVQCVYECESLLGKCPRRVRLQQVDKLDHELREGDVIGRLGRSFRQLGQLVRLGSEVRRRYRVVVVRVARDIDDLYRSAIRGIVLGRIPSLPDGLIHRFSITQYGVPEIHVGEIVENPLHLLRRWSMATTWTSL